MGIRTNMKNLTPRRQAYKTTIKLMSHGYTNPAAFPDGKLTIYPWDSSIDSLLLESSRNQADTPLYDILEHICDLNGGKVDDFVADEINVILLVSKSLSSDGILRYASQCPYCGTRRNEQIKVPDELEKVAEKSKDYPGYDLITLPDCKDVLAIRPIQVKDEKKITARSAEERALVCDTELRHIFAIVTVNETSPDTFEEAISYYRALSPKDVQHLAVKQKELTPHLNSHIPHRCDNPTCRREFRHMLTFSEEFFRSTSAA